MIASGLMVVASSGCSTKHLVFWSIDSDSIQAYQENPSGKPLTFEEGGTISFYTKKTIVVSSRKVKWVKMIVMDVNTLRIRGEVVEIFEAEEERDEEEKEDIEGNIVEVKLEDMESITVWDSVTERHIPDFPFDAIFLPLLMLLIAVQA